MSVTITGYTGCFDYLHPDRKQTCIRLSLPDGAPAPELSESWPEDDAPAWEDRPPSEIVDLIAARLESYWISTGREKKREVIAWCRQNIVRLDREWAETYIRYMEKEIAGMNKRIASLRAEYIEVDED